MDNKLRTIAAAIEISLARGITGEQAKVLLFKIRDMINEAEQLADLKADADYHSARSPVCGCEWGCWRCEKDAGQ